ncbi:malonic semialdehyde reductase [Haliangium sp. UPWRP_2]|uniref:malonic semialdehyde reductase n=1 Tax=Haliangium sp. UPWRP_2 TaxID=1931276 RepID=UPI001E33553C
MPHLLGSNVEQVRAAPVVAIVAYDAHFLDQITRLFPAVDVRPYFAGNEGLIHDTAFRNSTLQGAYFIMAARALGLDVCPMSGFNNAGVDEAFFQDRGWRSNFLCTLGYGDDTRLFPRGPRLSFSEACDIV